MVISDIYQFIWEEGAELPEYPGRSYATVEHILSAKPDITEKRLTERGNKSPYLSSRLSVCGTYIIGWFIPVPPKGSRPSRHRPRVHAPLPAESMPKALERKRMETLRQDQRLRVAVLGPFSCIPTLSEAAVTDTEYETPPVD